MTSRYFVDQPIVADSARLVGSEAQHLAKVMRAAPGDEVTLFDGSGAEFLAVVHRVDRNSAELAIRERRAIDRELPVPLTLAAALPKGDRQRWLIEKAVELGVAEFVPLETRRGVAQPSGGALARLSRAVVEASKQCGRNRLMQIQSPQTIDQLANTADRWPERIGLLAHVSSAAVPLAEAAAQACGRGVCLAIGPEGGFTDEEAAILAGWTVVSLGPRILRVETAAVAMAAYFSFSQRG